MGRPNLRCRLVVLALTLAGCGGGSDPAPIVTSTAVIFATASLDGFVRSDGLASAAGTGPAAGDLDSLVNGLAIRQFFSFDLSGFPAGATLVTATLQLSQTFVTGTPYGSHGVATLDHLVYGASLDSGDFGLGALASAFGTLSSNATLGLKVVDVTARVAADLAAFRTRSQYRVRFSVLDTNVDNGADYAQFADIELHDVVRRVIRPA